MAKTLFNISDKIVAGDTAGEALAYRDRIIADGGTLETFAETEAEIRRLQSLGLYDSLSLGYVAGGYKASKWYNIKGATGDLDVVRATNGTRDNRAGLIDTLGNNLTRADFDAGVLKGNWVESAATNQWLYSEPASATGYTATNVEFVSENLGGTVNAVRLADATVSRTLQRVIGNRQGQTLMLSFYVKVGTGVLPNQGEGNYRDFTLNIDSNDVINYTQFTYEDVGNGVYRVKFTKLFASTNLNASIRKYSGLNNDTPVVFSRIQLETGSRASTYIKTEATTVTRNADNISKTGIASEIGQTEGVIYAEVDVREGMVGKEIISLTDSSDSTNRNIRIFMNSGFNLTAQYRTATNPNSIVSSYNSVGVARIALAYKDNDPNGIRIFCNGINLENRSTNEMSATMSRLYVGRRFSIGNYLNDRIYSAYHWKTAKTDAELIALTTL